MKQHQVKKLTKSGLTQLEAEIFIALTNKIKPSQKELESFINEYESDIPFEGGIGFMEAIIGLQNTTK